MQNANDNLTQSHEDRVAAILSAAGVTYSAAGGRATARENGTDKPWPCYAWRVNFSKRGIGETFDFYCGVGHVTKPKNRAMAPYFTPRPLAPKAADVLSSLIMDASAERESFGDWCGNFGYDSDSISAFETYRACCAIAPRVRKVFTRAELDALAEVLADY